MKAGHIKDFDTTFIHNREYIETKGERDDVYCDKVLIFVTKTKSNQNFATSRFISPQHRKIRPIAYRKLFGKPDSMAPNPPTWQAVKI